VAKRDRLSGLEELALMTVVGLGSDAYGVSVQLRLERDGRRKVALGAVYAALDRLERKGYVSSSLGNATPQRGGRRVVRVAGAQWSNRPDSRHLIDSSSPSPGEPSGNRTGNTGRKRPRLTAPY
jgi:PadR family transcriptional regulator, regulatory protein PadR